MKASNKNRAMNIPGLHTLAWVRSLFAVNPTVNTKTFRLLLALFLSQALIAEASNVQIVQENGRYQLRLDGKPYTVKGVGMGRSMSSVGLDSFALLAQLGGNTFRTWELAELDHQLQKAEQHGLKVLVGLDSGKQLQGFDYNDKAAVAQQFSRLTAVVDKYKSHPSVLGWIIANEPNLMVDASGSLIKANPLVYDALGEITDYIHKNDPDHPVTFSFAFTPSIQEDVAAALQRAPAVDFISFQAYGALPAIAPLVDELELDRPYMVTEFGPLGHWEMPATSWGREIEETSAAKALGLLTRMQGSVTGETHGGFIGSFAFLWGYKQERTPTWYGLLTSEGDKLASVDELSRLWTGQWPENRAPLTQWMKLDGLPATDSVQLVAGQRVSASIAVRDPDNHPLQTAWQIRHEVAIRSEGGHFEQAPDSVRTNFTASVSQEESEEQALEIHRVSFDAPLEPGEYRLFAYTSDTDGGAGTANVPFLVTP